MLNYQIVTHEGLSTVSLFHEGKAYIANNNHPHWEKIVSGLTSGDASTVDLFDLAATVERKFQRLSDNITVENGQVCLYGDPVNGALADKVIEFLDAGVEDWKPLVLFFENTLLNPSEESRSMMFDFLSRNRFQITDEGMVVGYKGVYAATGEEADNHVKGTYRSAHQGTTPVSVNDGEARPGYVYQSIGDTVSMARSLVDDNRNQGCSAGLHVATLDYARSYGDGVTEVTFHPRDVVAVPVGEWQKMRVCKYTITGVAKEPTSGPIVYSGTLEPSSLTVEDEVDEDIEEDEWDTYDEDEDSWDSWEDEDDTDYTSPYWART